jgi:hypothetical protein
VVCKWTCSVFIESDEVVRLGLEYILWAHLPTHRTQSRRQIWAMVFHFTESGTVKPLSKQF